MSDDNPVIIRMLLSQIIGADTLATDAELEAATAGIQETIDDLPSLYVSLSDFADFTNGLATLFSPVGHTHSSADLPATLVYRNQSNTFSAPQQFNSAVSINPVADYPNAGVKVEASPIALNSNTQVGIGFYNQATGTRFGGIGLSNDGLLQLGASQATGVGTVVQLDPLSAQVTLRRYDGLAYAALSAGNITSDGVISAATDVRIGGASVATVAQLNAYLPTAGGTLYGNLNLSNNNITSVNTISAANVSTIQASIYDDVGGYLPLTSLSSKLRFNGNYIATEGYVSAAVSASATTAVPYTGATGNVNLGSQNLTAGNLTASGTVDAANVTIGGVNINTTYAKLFGGNAFIGLQTVNGTVQFGYNGNNNNGSTIIRSNFGNAYFEQFDSAGAVKNSMWAGFGNTFQASTFTGNVSVTGTTTSTTLQIDTSGPKFTWSSGLAQVDLKSNGGFYDQTLNVGGVSVLGGTGRGLLANGWASASGGLKIGGASSNMGGIWNSTLTPSLANFGIAMTGTSTLVNASSSVVLSVNLASKMQIETTGVTALTSVATDKVFVAKGAASHTGSYIEAQTSAGVAEFTVVPGGNVTASGTITASNLVGALVGTSGLSYVLGNTGVVIASDKVFASSGTTNPQSAATVTLSRANDTTWQMGSGGTANANGGVNASFFGASSSVYLGPAATLRLADYTNIQSGGNWGLVDIAPMTNAQSGLLRVYNDLRSITNYERLEIGQQTAGDAVVRTAAGGTGTRRNLTLDAPVVNVTGNIDMNTFDITNFWELNGLLVTASAVYSDGELVATRGANIFTGNQTVTGNITASGSVTVSGTIRSASRLETSNGTNNVGKNDIYTFSNDAYFAQYNFAGSAVNILQSNGGNTLAATTVNGNLTVGGDIRATPANTFINSAGAYWAFTGGGQFLGQFAGTNAIGGSSTGLHAPSFGFVSSAGLAPTTTLSQASAGIISISNAAGTAGFIARADNGRLLAGYDAGGDYIAAGNSLGTSVPLYVGSSAHSMIRFHSVSERMRIVGSTGNVLIGTTTDDGGTGAKLTVSTGIYTPGFIWATGGLTFSTGHTITTNPVNGSSGILVSSGQIQLVTNGPVIKNIDGTGVDFLRNDGITKADVSAASYRMIGYTLGPSGTTGSIAITNTTAGNEPLRISAQGYTFLRDNLWINGSAGEAGIVLQQAGTSKWQIYDASDRLRVYNHALNKELFSINGTTETTNIGATNARGLKVGNAVNLTNFVEINPDKITVQGDPFKMWGHQSSFMSLAQSHAVGVSGAGLDSPGLKFVGGWNAGGTEYSPTASILFKPSGSDSGSLCFASSGYEGLRITKTDNRPSVLQVNSPTISSAMINVTTNWTGKKGILVQGVVDQTENLFEGKNSLGAMQFSVGPTGGITTNDTFNIGGHGQLTWSGGNFVVSGTSSKGLGLRANGALSNHVLIDTAGNSTFSGVVTAKRATAASYGVYAQGVNANGYVDWELNEGLIAGTYGGSLTLRAGDAANTGFIRLRYDQGYPKIATNQSGFNIQCSNNSVQFANTYFSITQGANVVFMVDNNGTGSTITRTDNGLSVLNLAGTAPAPVSAGAGTFSGTLLATNANNSGRFEVRNGTSGNLVVLGDSGTGNVTINNSNTVGGNISLQSRGVTMMTIEPTKISFPFLNGSSFIDNAGGGVLRIFTYPGIDLQSNSGPVRLRCAGSDGLDAVSTGGIIIQNPASADTVPALKILARGTQLAPLLQLDSGGTVDMSFGGMTAAAVGLKRVGTTLNVKLADNSNYATVAAKKYVSFGTSDSAQMYWSDSNVSMDFRNAADNAFVAARAGAFYTTSGGMWAHQIYIGTQTAIEGQSYAGYGGLRLGSGQGIYFSSTTSFSGIPDASIIRPAANTIRLANTVELNTDIRMQRSTAGEKTSAVYEASIPAWQTTIIEKASPSGPQLAFYGGVPVSKQSLPENPTNAEISNVLAALGLVTQTPS